MDIWEAFFFGILILKAGNSRFNKSLLGAIAVLLLYISWKYASNLFTLVYSAGFAAFILVLYLFGSEWLNDLAIDVIGITSVAYSICDIFVDTILLSLWLPDSGRQTQITDAMQLAHITGIPALVWGLIWMALSVLAVKWIIYPRDNIKYRQRRSS